MKILKSQEIPLNANDKLTLSCDSLSSGFAQKIKSGVVVNTVSINANESFVFGPYSEDCIIKVVCLSCFIDYSYSGDAENYLSESKIKKTSLVQYPYFSEPQTSGAMGMTFQTMHVCPKKFTAVRLGLLFRGGSGNSATVKAIIASTDNSGSRSYTDYQTTSHGTANAASVINTPKKSGTTYNVAAAGGDPGFHRVKWGGSTTSPSITDPTADNFAVLWSDLIPIDGLYDDNIDGYPLLIKIYGTGIMPYIYSANGEIAGTNIKDDFYGKGSFYNATDGNNDWVTTLPSSWDDTIIYKSNIANGNVNQSPLIIDYTVDTLDTKTILVAGDSRIGISSELLDTKAYMSTYGIVYKKLIELGVDCTMISCAYSGWSSVKYYNMTKELLKYSKPDYVVYLISTVNDGAVSGSVAETQIQQAFEICKTVKEYGGKIIYITDFPRDSTLSASQLLNVKLVRDFATQYGDYVIDPFTIYGNGAGQWLSYRYDANHMTQSGYTDLAGKIVYCIKAG